MFILRLLSRLWRQAGAWRRGRRWRYFLQGLPALLAGAALLIPTLAALATPAQELEARYLEQAKNALKAKDYALSMTCYDRLAYLGIDRPEVLYGLALSAEGLRQTDRAKVVMNALAPPKQPGLDPPDQPGYARAHFWQACRILSAPAAPDSRDEAESHLLRALDGELDDREAAHALLGELYLEAKRYDEAEAHLTKAVKAKPQLRIRLAQLYALRGDKERARNEAQLAVSYFRARAKADLEDRRARLGWADATTFLEDFPGAVTILQEGLNVSDDPVYRAALGGVYFVWADAVSRDPSAKPGDELALVEQGLRYDPNDVGLLNKLLDAVRVGGAKADQARESLQALLAAGKAPASVHFALGLDALGRGKADEARLHFERANELAPQTPSIANNLAWVLATEPADLPVLGASTAGLLASPLSQGPFLAASALFPGRTEPADLPRALDLSNLAVQQAPNDSSFRDTRGRILMKMGRWKDALDDLEAALPANQDNADLHNALADVYEHVGDPDMAAKHRRLAEKKTNEKAGSPPPAP